MSIGGVFQLLNEYVEMSIVPLLNVVEVKLSQSLNPPILKVIPLSPVIVMDVRSFEKQRNLTC